MRIKLLQMKQMVFVELPGQTSHRLRPMDEVPRAVQSPCDYTPHMPATKVGRIDDSIWAEAAPAQPLNEPRPSRHKRRWWLLLGIVALLLMVGGLVWTTLPSGRTGGDPGNKVLAALTATVAEVPSGTSGVGVLPFATAWTEPCSGQPGQAGWSPVRVTKTVTTPIPGPDVARQITAELGSQGWKRNDTVPARGQGSLLRWMKSMPTGSQASLFALRNPSGPGWFISASWNPPGLATAGC
jgi:hypothetical protein